MPRADANLAVVLLSGGLDSTTTLAIARRDGFLCHALSFDYGQRHRLELAAARRIAQALGAVEHRIVRVDLSASGGFGRSALTDDIPVPKDRIGGGAADASAGPGRGANGSRRDLGNPQSAPRQAQGGLTSASSVEPSLPKAAIRNPQSAIPVTYVPARNTIFLSIALGYAEVIGSFDIFIGTSAIDYSGYPDCRPAFVEAFERLANLATAAGVEGRGRFRIHAPLVQMTKAQIIRTGLELGVDYALTHSCYDPSPDGIACGHCDSCRLRLAGFAAAGVPDPARYRQPT